MNSYLNNRLIHYPSYFPDGVATNYYSRLKNETQWLSPFYTNPDGKIIHLPRLTANYGEKSYNYSNLVFEPFVWTDLLLSLKDIAENLAEQTFNALVIQFYRDGNDGVNWHSDEDGGIGKNPVIVSMSFGDTRTFMFKPKALVDSDSVAFALKNGDIVIMKDDLQHTHLHRIPKEENKTGRINLTFRKIVE